MADIKSISTFCLDTQWNNILWPPEVLCDCGNLPRGSAMGQLWPGTCVWGVWLSLFFFFNVFVSPTYPTWQFMIKMSPKRKSSKVRWSRILSNFPTTDMYRLLSHLPQTGLIGRSPCAEPSHIGVFASCCTNKNVFSSIYMTPFSLDISFCLSDRVLN